VPLGDLRQSYADYMRIAGLDDRKRKLRAYLNWLEIDAAKMTAADRDLSERVLRAITADPIAGAMFVRVTASNRVVHLTSSDSNAEQRDRIVDVVGRVPGVAGVEADMK
jgi:osmotically-inducible protein OsmY